MNTLRHLIILSLCLTAAGCGFKLRQSSALPEIAQAIEVTCKIPQDNHCLAIKRELNQYTSDKQTSITILEIGKTEIRQTAKSIDNKARAAEYEISLTVNTELIHKKSGTRLFEKEIQRRQRYRYQEDNVLAKERESNEIIKRLSKQIAQALTKQLAPYNQEKISALVAQPEHKLSE